MELIVPRPLALAKTGSSPTFIYSAWTTSGSPYYAINAMVRYQVSGVWYDYRCRFGHVSNSSIPPTNFYYWTKVGVASTSGGYTYTTNVRLSNATTWTSGAAITAGTVVYDNGDNRDYQATVAITSANNTIRPSEAVLSSTEAIAARWISIGAANAWAPLDYILNTYLWGYDASGNQVNPTFTLDATYLGNYYDRISFSGLVDVAEVMVEVYERVGAGALTKTQTVTQSLIPSGGFDYYRSANLKLTRIHAYTLSELKFVVTLTKKADPTVAARCGVITAGPVLYLGETEWDVTTRLLSFSRKERNQDYGTVTFVKRGSARAVQAVGYLDPAVIPGDVVQQTLGNYDGVPCFYDFNNSDTSYDRLRVFGFWTRAEIVIKTASHESLVIDIEGLTD